MVMEITQAERNAVQLDLRKLPALAKQQIEHAELPARYKAARKALQECYRIDELKDISDKHSAIAHYAKQAKDPSLMYYAERIKLRAFERIGELLAEIKDYNERKQVAQLNGVAIVTANKAYTASHIPKKVRDTLIEATPPPSIRKFADYGERYIPNPSWQAREGWRNYRRKEEEVKPTPATAAHALADYVSSWQHDIEYILSDRCGGKFTPKQVARAVHPDDVRHIREPIVYALEVLDEFEQYLPKES